MPMDPWNWSLHVVLGTLNSDALQEQPVLLATEALLSLFPLRFFLRVSCDVVLADLEHTP